MPCNKIREQTAILKELAHRILVLDGAMGTMIMRQNLSEADYRGKRFVNSAVNLKGCHDILSLTRPDVVREIHSSYLEAGADIISTNSFNSNVYSLKYYGLEDFAYEISRQSAHLARSETDAFNSKQSNSKPRFVAGTIGPTRKAISKLVDVKNTGTKTKSITFNELVDAYTPQVEGLLDGGCDIILIETIFDTLNANAAICAAESVFERRQTRYPIMISITISHNSSHTLTCQKLEAFVNSFSYASPLSLGLNCVFGSEWLLTNIKRLANLTSAFVSCHPNAGLPNALGEYDVSPEAFTATIEKLMKLGLVNIVGGCCGTTPDHIRALAAAAKANNHSIRLCDSTASLAPCQPKNPI